MLRKCNQTLKPKIRLLHYEKALLSARMADISLRPKVKYKSINTSSEYLCCFCDNSQKDRLFNENQKTEAMKLDAKKVVPLQRMIFIYSLARMNRA